MTDKPVGFTHESTHNESQEWYTPPEIFAALRTRFDLDPASPGKERVPWIPVARHVTIAEDGLTVPWEGSVWLNPPYGPKTPEWVERFIAQPCTGLMLVFARTDVRWFHEWAVQANCLCFVRSRVKFIRGDGYVGGGYGAGSLLLAKGELYRQVLHDARLGFCADGRLP